MCVICCPICYIFELYISRYLISVTVISVAIIWCLHLKCICWVASICLSWSHGTLSETVKEIYNY